MDQILLPSAASKDQCLSVYADVYELTLQVERSDEGVLGGAVLTRESAEKLAKLLKKFLSQPK